MNISKQNYGRYVRARAPHSPVVRDCVRAFLCGGFICALGEGFNKFYIFAGVPAENAGLACSVTLIFISALLTGIGVYDKMAKYAGAGMLVPITGFANSVVSSAMDSYHEGIVVGIGSKIFTVCGPVLLYGTLAGTLYGIIYYIIGLF